MNINLQTKLYDKNIDRFICFNCAVKSIVTNNDNDLNIEMLTNEYGSDYDFRDTSCHVCGKMTQ